jgi:hypothetical protein
MKHEELYNEWIGAHKQTEVRSGFVDGVMREIRRADAAGGGSASPWTRLLEWIDRSPWAKAAVLCVAGTIGIGRGLLGIHLLFAFPLLGI